MSCTPHPYRDAVIAWANDGDVEFCRSDQPNVWRSWGDAYGKDSTPSFHVKGVSWRPKQKIVKREGWLNVYRHNDTRFLALVSTVYASESDANRCRSSDRIDCVRIEWEEKI